MKKAEITRGVRIPYLIYKKYAAIALKEDIAIREAITRKLSE